MKNVKIKLFYSKKYDSDRVIDVIKNNGVFPYEIIQVDDDLGMLYAHSEKVKMTPCIMFYNGDDIFGRHVGFITKEKLLDKIEIQYINRRA